MLSFSLGFPMDRVLALSSGWMLGQFKEMERTMRVVDFAVKLKRSVLAFSGWRIILDIQMEIVSRQLEMSSEFRREIRFAWHKSDLAGPACDSM